MPIYEYRCSHCGHETEAIQKLSEPPLVFCPACESEGLKKKISAPVFRLKGSGWYETDFKSEGKRNVAGDESGGPKDEKGESGDKVAGKESGASSQTAKSEGGAGGSEKNTKMENKTEKKPAGNDKSETRGPAPRAASTK